MKKTALVLRLILAFAIFISFRTYFIDEATCSGTLTVTVNSPQDRVYNSYNVDVSISASDPAMLTGPESVAYSLDVGPQVIISTAPLGMHSLSGSTILSLPNGRHEIVGIGITWFNGTTDGIFYSESVYFTVDSPIDYVPTPTTVTTPTPTPPPTPAPSPTPKPTLSPEPTIFVTPLAEPFPASLVFVAAVGIALAVIGLLVHFKKRKR